MSLEHPILPETEEAKTSEAEVLREYRNHLKDSQGWDNGVDSNKKREEEEKQNSSDSIVSCQCAKRDSETGHREGNDAFILPFWLKLCFEGTDSG